MSGCILCACLFRSNREMLDMKGRWLLRTHWHGTSRMKKWVLGLAALALAGVVLQFTAMSVKGTSNTWFFRLDLALNATPTPPAMEPAATSTPLRPGLLLALRKNVSEAGAAAAAGDDDARRRNSTPGLQGGAHAHHPYRFLLNEPDACSEKPELVVVVITAVKNARDRQAVRDTWGSARDGSLPNATLVFLVGATSDRAQQAALEAESGEHHDLVQEDFVDSYRNLSLKSLAMLKWVTTFCNSSTYVLKADDDMYVNVSNLLAALRKESLSHSAFVLGAVFTGARPILNKKSKWYTPKELFSEAVYPRYASGTAYSMTMSAARRLYAAAAHVPTFWLEDIYITGLCSRKAGVPVYNHGGFSYRWRKVDGCHFRKAISGHRYSAQDKRAIFKLVKDPNLKCPG